MLNLIRDILTSPAGSFASMLSVLLLLFFLIFKAGKLVEKYKVVDVILANIDKIKDDISEIKAFMKISRQDISGFSKAHSPIGLTEKGTTVSTDLHVEESIAKNWERLCKRIKDTLKKGSNPYDIQEICFGIGEKYSELISDDDFKFARFK